MDFSVIIPARYASSRFPAKLLEDINGRSLIEHTYLNALKSSARRVIIATDDERISNVAKNFGAEVCMTSSSHTSGTSRLFEVASDLDFDDDEIVVNVQGDEPMLNAEVINQVAFNLVDSCMDVATLCEKIESKELYFDPNCVKVVYNSRGKALYFSRSPIPAFRNEHDIDLDVCFRHVGLYAYRVSFIKKYFQMEKSDLELSEKLEQLTILSNGMDIHVGIACAPTGYGIDTENDLKRAKKEMTK
jgi:3-deoxy-manno-octulosonate cytidylyltransferase (CMP-KDO synthetase)